MVSPTVAFADDSSTSAEAAPNADECYQEGYDACANIEAEGAVLLKNEGDVLPLAEGTKVTILGAMSYNYVEGGTGSAGGADDENTVMMNDAFTEAGLDVNAAAWDWLAEQCGGSRNAKDTDPGSAGKQQNAGGFGASSGGTWTSYQYIHEFSPDVYEGAKATIAPSDYTNYAIVTFSRSGSEGASPSMDMDGDGSTLTGSTYFELNQNEKDLLTFCKNNYKHTIVLINSAAAMELGFLDSAEYNVEACLWIGHPGEAGLAGVGTLLTGRNNPSGRLVDTYAYDVTTNPTYYNTDDNKYTNVQVTLGQVGMGGNTENQSFYQYEEGIYVGYRYFETADAMGYFDSSDFSSIAFKNGSVKGYDQVVQFPFGYGLSYTTFTEEVSSSDIKLEAHGTNKITVKVTNSGAVAGKDVVELYMDAPWQSDTDNFGIKGVGLEKSKVVLIGFAKTDVIDAGASAEATIEFATDDLASFDNFGQGCYVLENGTYKFNIQKDAHQWGDEGSTNAPSATVSVQLDTPIIYDDKGDVAGATYAGMRNGDKAIAKNAMDDVTAGDGNMLDGYLSRANIAGGMKQIMSHTSDETPNEQVTDAIKACLECSGTDTVEYSFQTYRKGVKTTLTETIYAKGTNAMPFSTTLPDGTTVSDEFPEWDKTYYVTEGKTTDSGLPVVTEDEPVEAHHKLIADDLVGIGADTEEKLALWDMLASETSIDEAIEVQGNSGWKVPEVASVEKPAWTCQDGPGEAANGNFAGNTWFPCAVSIASTWNQSLAKAYGVAYGHQSILAGNAGVYAPAMNMHRSPFGGRDFEYYSEDGYISGKMGASAVSGIQSTGTSVFIKHCAMNDGDTNRGGNTCWADEQAIREIYMRPYEISIKEGLANGVMGSLNRIGMSWFHYGMYVTMMRDEWGWQGFLITDGDGQDGDVYNSPQMMLSIQGAILNNGGYINNPTTEAAYGDATQYPYGQQCLHDVMRHCLYQYAGPKYVDESGNATGAASTAGATKSGSGLPVVGIVGGIVAATAIAGIIVGVRKRGSKGEKETKNTKVTSGESQADDEDEEE
jgi:beta-glucosidase